MRLSSFYTLTVLLPGTCLSPAASAQSAAASTLPVARHVVVPGDTLWSVASAQKSALPGLSTAQMAWAILQANPEAFDDGVTQLPVGTTLYIPPAEIAASVPSADAARLLQGPVPAVMPQGASATAAAADAATATASAAPTDAAAQPAAAGTAIAAADSGVPEPGARGAFSAQPVYREAQALIAAKKAAEAYALLAPLEAQWAGDTDYDYLVGVAALDSGRASEAVLSLQRAVTGAPSYAGARMELARAYFATGDNEDARREFEIVQSQNPPPQAAAAIEQYLAAVDRRAERYEPALHGLLDISGGYDSNANGGSSADRFLGFELNDASKRAESAFAGVNGSLDYTRPLVPRWRWRSGLGAGHREVFDASFATTTEGSLNTALVYSADRLQSSLALSGRWLALDGEANQQTTAADFGLQWASNENLAWIATARLAAVRYEEPVTVQDVDQWIAGLGLWWRPKLGRRVELQLGPIGGHEDAREEASPYGRDLLGVRATAVAVYGGLIWRGSLGTLHSEYDGRFFGAERQDDQTTASIGVEVPRIFGAWALHPQVGYVDNHSDVALFDYERVYASVSFTRGF